ENQHNSCKRGRKPGDLPDGRVLIYSIDHLLITFRQYRPGRFSPRGEPTADRSLVIASNRQFTAPFFVGSACPQLPGAVALSSTRGARSVEVQPQEVPIVQKRHEGYRAGHQQDPTYPLSSRIGR